MSYDYEIIADMSIDIDKAIAEKYDLKYIPMDYSLGDETFSITEPESYDTMMNFYAKLREKVPTSTTQISPYNYIEAMKPYAEAGKNVLYLSLSSGLSSTYESACSAAEMLAEDYPDFRFEVVDSLSATTGFGALMEVILKNREKGMSIDENAKWARDHVQNVNHWFVVQDLFYLMRGGRVSAPAAALGSALNLKPVLTINREGKLETIAKKRGENLAIKYLVQCFEDNFDPSVNPDNEAICNIACAGCPETAETVKNALLAKHPELTIHISMLSPIIGAHTGPDMYAVTFLGKERA